MFGWITAAILYGLGALFVFKCSNDRRAFRAALWPGIVVFLALT